MNKISAHFNRSEFACQCGNCPQSKDPTVDVKLIGILEDLRKHFKAPITITSGNRCRNHNSSVGGSVFSQHLFGRAADVLLKGISPDEVHKYLFNRYPEQYGLGKYATFTHIDSRGLKARWEITG
jgi:uncharacterized protein YcbK (DUF882 family)